MRRRRVGLGAVLLAGTLALTSCGWNTGTDPETYVRDAMSEATSIKEKTGHFPRGVDELSLGDYDGVGNVWFVTNNDASVLCVELSVPDAKYSVYSSEPSRVTEGTCDMDKVQ
ncbi:hypothetical protein [Micromonospora sp. DT31]|uniref:hypothetical protein n=1 Tax=Micromonospora sp. DT31 TaxID=3393434 RepID=UPI003CEE82E8